MLEKKGAEASHHTKGTRFSALELGLQQLTVVFHQYDVATFNQLTSGGKVIWVTLLAFG